MEYAVKAIWLVRDIPLLSLLEAGRLPERNLSKCESPLAVVGTGMAALA